MCDSVLGPGMRFCSQVVSRGPPTRSLWWTRSVFLLRPNVSGDGRRGSGSTYVARLDPSWVFSPQRFHLHNNLSADAWCGSGSWRSSWALRQVARSSKCSSSETLIFSVFSEMGFVLMFLFDVHVCCWNTNVDPHWAVLCEEELSLCTGWFFWGWFERSTWRRSLLGFTSRSEAQQGSFWFGSTTLQNYLRRKCKRDVWGTWKGTKGKIERGGVVGGQVVISWE